MATLFTEDSAEGSGSIRINPENNIHIFKERTAKFKRQSDDP